MMMDRDERLTGSWRGQRVRLASQLGALVIRMLISLDGPSSAREVLYQLGMGYGEDQLESIC